MPRDGEGEEWRLRWSFIFYPKNIWQAFEKEESGIIEGRERRWLRWSE